MWTVFLWFWVSGCISPEIESRSRAAAPVRWEVVDAPGCDTVHPRGGLVSLSTAPGSWGMQSVTSATTRETSPWGLAVADFTGDDWLDVYLPQFGGGELYANDGQGGLERRVGALPPQLAAAMGATPVDVDADGDLDIAEARFGELAIFLNDGSGQFVEGTPLLSDTGQLHLGSSWADMDGDGDLDVYVPAFPGALALDGSEGPGGEADWLLRNDGAGVFVDARGLLPAANDGQTFAGGFHDLDGDGVPEVLLCNDHGAEVRANQAWWWEGASGGYASRPEGLGLEVAMECMGLAVGDLSGDGVPDGVMSGWDALLLAESDPAGWHLAQAARGLTPADPERQRVAWGAAMEDLDNDGDLDVAVSYGHWEIYARVMGLTEDNPVEQPNALFLQGEDGAFADVAEAWGVADAGIGRGLVLADLNLDGQPDWVQRRIFSTALVAESRCQGGAWLLVSLRQPGDNPAAIGARIEVEADGQRWSRTIQAGGSSLASSGPPEVHLGLGERSQVDVLRVIWPDGTETTRSGVATRQRLRGIRGEGG